MKDLKNNLEILFSNMENFISTKTVVGDPIHIGETIILPLIDVVFGVGASSSEKDKNDKQSGSNDGGGLGAKVIPSAVLVINQKSSQVQLVNVKNQDAINKLIDMAPGLLSKLQESIFKGKNKEENQKDQEEKEKENQIMKAILENDKGIKEEI